LLWVARGEFRAPGTIGQIRFIRRIRVEPLNLDASPILAIALYFGHARVYNALRNAERPPTWQGAPTFAPRDRWTMIEELKRKLSQEVEHLQHELTVILPGEIRKAAELGDLRENSEYKAALERQQFVQARLGQLRQRLSKLSQIDMTQIPTDRVGLGSRVVVKDTKTGASEEYHLVFGDAAEFDEGHVSMASPIGKALVGKGVGDITMLRLPSMTRQLEIVELTTIHDGDGEE
jgi:transcription elongation factor GreA